jgi:hypothetical protein
LPLKHCVYIKFRVFSKQVSSQGITNAVGNIW